MKSLLLITMLVGVVSISPSLAFELKVVPTFENCGVYIRTENLNADCDVQFRKAGSEKWQKAFKPVPPPKYPTPKGEESDCIRGSIVSLEENTEYQVKVEVDGVSKTERFKTLNSKVSIGETIYIEDLVGRSEFVIEEKGSPDAWIKITSRDGRPVNLGLKNESGMLIRNSSHLILENLILIGGGQCCVTIEDSENIHLVNADLSGYGRVAKADYNFDGRHYADQERKGYDRRPIALDSGINVVRSGRILVERCFVHDANGTSTTWLYAHPLGAEPMHVYESRGQIVVRYNDFIGSDQHNWDDGIVGSPNTSPRGGFHRDSDIYGNLVMFANDDGCELDGGAMNIRLYYNKFEANLQGLSTDPCILGPTYVFRNLIYKLGDSEGRAYDGIKLSGRPEISKGTVFYFHNTFYGRFSAWRGLNGVTRNNICLPIGRFPVKSLREGHPHDYDHDMFFSSDSDALERFRKLEKNALLRKPAFVNESGVDFRLGDGSPGIDEAVSLANFNTAFQGAGPDMGALESGGRIKFLPARPIPIISDRYTLECEGEFRRPVSVQHVTLRNEGGGSGSKFRILKNHDFDWIRVAPETGTILAGEQLRLTIQIDSKRMERPGLYRGAFLVKNEDDFSLPISVYVNIRDNRNFIAEWEMETLADKSFETQSDEEAGAGKYVVFKGSGEVGTTVEIPEDGHYFMYIRGRSTKAIREFSPKRKEIELLRNFRLQVDDREAEYVALGRGFLKFGYIGVPCFKEIFLKKGTHSLKLQATEKGFHFDRFVVSSSPFAPVESNY